MKEFIRVNINTDTFKSYKLRRDKDFFPFYGISSQLSGTLLPTPFHLSRLTPVFVSPGLLKILHCCFVY